jgi:ribosomal protein S18 acetylase RimI-like enzyme
MGLYGGGDRMIYIENDNISAKYIADLRESVGWNRMEQHYSSPLLTSFLHISCYDGERLVGYADSVSNGLTDAYIQDVMVHPDYQGKGIGTELMKRMIARLKERKIYMISCIYGEPELSSFYKRFGFTEMLCGQLQTYETE